MFIDFGKNIWTVLPEERKLDWMTSEALVNSIFILDYGVFKATHRRSLFCIRPKFSRVEYNGWFFYFSLEIDDNQI
ncbi:hypothetical protein XBKQ1_1850015 [Xenorhabdus bovienii str. kraussei Quebec]|uniref:Uncharacterized protein n=1 Tax=Xenorhabdus bovienii str. kraussei Quebec TaxID=1398203 RepID=A0A077P3P8_XENBV|nr:hypothetical protein XBKQ1_1850015 [Xenorhabdus bovienii str. kraussei Quebec]